MFSAVHPTTDIAKILRHVRFVPIASFRAGSHAFEPRPAGRALAALDVGGGAQ